MIGVTYDQDILDNPSNYLLKFEVNTLMALTKRQIRFYFSQINYDWEPFASGLAFNTNGEWSTVTIDLSEAWKGTLSLATLIPYYIILSFFRENLKKGFCFYARKAE